MYYLSMVVVWVWMTHISWECVSVPSLGAISVWGCVRTEWEVCYYKSSSNLEEPSVLRAETEGGTALGRWALGSLLGVTEEEALE